MNERPYTLTDEEANTIKDLLKEVNLFHNRRFIKEFAVKLDLPIKRLDAILDSAFIKLGNGRVTVV